MDSVPVSSERYKIHSIEKSPVPKPKSDCVVVVNLSPTPSNKAIPDPNFTGALVTICALPTAVIVFFALLNGVINPVALPSITTVFVSTLSIVEFASNVPAALYNEIVFPAEGADPLNPLYFILVFPSPFNPDDPSTISIPLSAKYVKQFNHSILEPLVTFNAVCPGVIKVTE